MSSDDEHSEVFAVSLYCSFAPGLDVRVGQTGQASTTHSGDVKLDAVGVGSAWSLTAMLEDLFCIRGERCLERDGMAFDEHVGGWGLLDE